MIYQSALVAGRRIKSGIPAIDRMLDIGSCIVTLRAPSLRWLSSLAASIIIKSHQPGMKSLYLHWVDYHKRYWTLDYDRICAAAKESGLNPSALSEEWFFIRAFSRDNVETAENWEMIHEFAEGVDIAILDSACELFGKGSRKTNSKNISYVLANFSRLCKRENCFGIVLERSDTRMHYYLGEISSIIIEFGGHGRKFAMLQKHPCQPMVQVELSDGMQHTLGRWIC